MNEQRTCTPIQVGDVTITPIAEVSLDAVHWSRILYVRGSIKPIAVLIRRDGDEVRVEVPEVERKRRT